MNFDNCKKISPDKAFRDKILLSVTENDGAYINLLSALKSKKRSKKWLVILSETVAAVALVTAISVWAILGRGMRIGTQTPSVSTQTPVYTVAYSSEQDRVVYAAKDLQLFFDDYVNGKACELKLFRSDSSSDGVYFGYSNRFTVNEDGSGRVYYVSDGETGIPDTVHGTYDFAVPYVDFEKITFLFSRNDNRWYMSYGGSFISFAADCIVNNYQNSDRVYDADKAQAVTVQNGAVTAGEEALGHFFAEFTKNRYAEVKVNGEYYTAVRRMTDITLTSENGLVAIKLGEREFLALTQAEVQRLGILYNGDNVTVIGNGNLDPVTVEDDTSFISALKESEQEQYKTHLETECEYTVKINDWFSICLYDEDGNGNIDGTVGFLYSYNTYPLAMRVSDALMLELEHLVKRLPVTKTLDEQTAAKVVSLAHEYRFDYLPDFDSADSLSYEDVINYVCAMNGFPNRIKTKQLNETTEKMLGVTFSVRDDYYVPISIEGSADYGSDTKKLVSFKIVNGGDIEAEFESYLPTSEAFGSDTPYRIQRVTYIPDTDGLTPIKILSNYNGVINDNGERVYNRPNHNPEYAKRWQYLRDALDEYFEGTGEIDEYMLRNRKFYATPDETGKFVFSFIGDLKPKPEYAEKYNAEEDGWVYTYWITLEFEETDSGIKCLGELNDDPVGSDTPVAE